MNIGMTIKKIRTAKGITQERLAEYLNLSVSAISQWECGKTMPDITLLPVLANIFDITTDELLEVDLTKKQEEINRIIAEYDRMSNLGLEKEKFDYIKAAYQRFPNAAPILEKYLWTLNYDPYCDNNDGRTAHEDELITLCERILSDSTVDSLRYTALSILSGVYAKKGDLDNALSYAKRFPAYDTAGEQIEYLYECGSDQWWEQVRENIYLLTEQLMVKIRNCALYAPLPPVERIGLFNKAVSLLDLIYDEGDYGFAHYHLCELHIWIAKRYIEMKDYVHAEEHLDCGLSHAKRYDALPFITKHSSFLVHGHVFETAKVYSGFTGNDVKRELDYIDEDEFYNGIREMEWFRNVLAKYRPFASEHKPTHVRKCN